MKIHMTRVTALLLAMLLLISTFALGASAREILDPSRAGSLTLTFTYKYEEEVKAVAGGKVHIYRVADAGFDADGNEVFTFTAPFAGSKLDLTDLTDNKGLSKQADDYLQKNLTACDSVKKTTLTNSKGVAPFRNLPLGLYLVVLDAENRIMDPFLISVPQNNDDGTKNYDVVSNPKSEVTYETMDIKVIKVWKGDKVSDRPKSIKVQLLHNGQIAEEAELNADNQWQVTFLKKPREGVWTVQEATVPDGYRATVTGPVLTDGVYVYTIVNTKKAPPPPLIQTGQLNWPVPLLMIAGTVLILSGWMISHGKKKEN